MAVENTVSSAVSMAEEIEPVAVVPMKRRKIIMNWQLCIYCQSTKRGTNLSKATQQVIERMTEAYKVPKTNADNTIHGMLHRIEWDLESITENSPVWHKQCYASFTSRVNFHAMVECYKKKHAQGPPLDQEPDIDVDQAPLT
ncbi:hypothetical protein SK128_010682 [Halocaridina rubra]|uniref:Uncharacterized protein n=1 Tax=Halocaridina rubra TaxID=373956 RepID=A0AAN8ZWC3_HALRR